MTLRQRQTKFAWMMAEFLLWCRGEGYEITMGETWRPGSKLLHGLRLAVDLNLFIDGKYQRSTEAHRPLGEEWERRGGSWGGRFSKKDGNHYSLPYGGMR